MPDKLSESTWTTFVKKKNLDLGDGPLVKALARLDKTDESKHQALATALDEVIEQIKKQVTALAKRKKELGDKAFGEIKDKLYALLDDAEKQQAQARRASATASKSADDDEEESPALLTSKMIPLIRDLRKGDVTMPSLIALAGKETVVLLSRRPISPARGKLLKDQMSNPNGLKFIRGECLLENQALTFVVQAPAAGLAKRIKAALALQTDLRLKVRVRGEDGEDAADDDQEALAAGETSEKPEEEPKDLAAAFKARLATLLPRIKAAGETDPAAQALKLKAGEAGELARQGKFVPASAKLDELELLLTRRAQASAQAPSQTPTPVPAPQAKGANEELRALVAQLKPGILALSKQTLNADKAERLKQIQLAWDLGQQAMQEGKSDRALAILRKLADSQAIERLGNSLTDTNSPASASPVSLVELGRARIGWNETRAQALGEIKRLKAIIKEGYAGNPKEQKALTDALKRLDLMITTINTDLGDSLDAVLNANTAERPTSVRTAKTVLSRVTNYVSSDPILAVIDGNEYAPDMKVAAPLLSRLKGIAGVLGQR